MLAEANDARAAQQAPDAEGAPKSSAEVGRRGVRQEIVGGAGPVRRWTRSSVDRSRHTATIDESAYVPAEVEVEPGADPDLEDGALAVCLTGLGPPAGGRSAACRTHRLCTSPRTSTQAGVSPSAPPSTNR